MFSAGKVIHRTTFLVATLVVFSLMFYGVAMASGGTSSTGSAQEVAHESGEEGGQGQGEDRSGDLRDLLYRIINFTLMVIILVWAIKKVGLKDSITGRIEEIRQRLDDLKREKEESEGSYSELEKRIRDFEQERKEILEQLKKEGEAAKEKIIAEAVERARQIMEHAELTIQQEMESARERLKKEAMELAAQRAQERITKGMTNEDQDRLVDEFIERVGEIH